MNRKNTIKGTTLHFIGLGGAGCNILEYFHKRGLKGKYTCISNPERPLLSSSIKFIKFIPPVKSYTEDGEESYGVSDMSQPLVVPKEVKDIISANDMYILLTGLGGYTGTYMTELFTTLLKEQNKQFLTICSLPFAFEKERKLYADKITIKFQGLPNFKYYDLEVMKENYGDKTLKEVFEMIDEQFYRIFTNFTKQCTASS